MISKFPVRLLLISILLLLAFHLPLSGQISFPANSSFRYLKGNQAASLPSTWKDPGYNDAAWASGNAPFWYGDGTGGTEITDMQNNYLTLYFRTSFEATNVVNLTEATFSVDYDDGFAIWINGEVALSRNAPASYAYDAPATSLHESGAFEQFTVSGSNLNLVEGTNTLAIQCFNENLTSSDIHFNMSLNAIPSIPVLPDSVGISFSLPSGYYESAFALTLTSPDPTANIVYTIDGSNPQESLTAITDDATANVVVDPSISTGRGTTPGFVVRASLVKDGYNPSYPESRTYIFFDELFGQTYPGHNWPAGNVTGIVNSGEAQTIDYDMDPDIINDSRYTDQMRESFRDVPTVSITTANENLFDPNIGIYVNPEGHGAEWERECNVELFDPDGDEEGFCVNAGLRIRGGYSRRPIFPKHAFRLFFRSEYGDAKLYYPLFGDEGVDEFDKIDLRTSQNYAWARNGSEHNTMLREVFSRDLQGEMGYPYTRSRYYHLFVNGLYWGLFQSQERSEARFASDYLGDSKEDYDVVKRGDGDGLNIEATDGNLDGWREVYNATLEGFEDNEAYFAMEGKDAWGKPLPGTERLIDIDNLIDYMIGIFYTGNFDAPVSKFMGNDGPNNFYAIYDRDDMDKGFIFFHHDAEHALFYDAVSPGIGINENRVNIGSLSDHYRMTISGFTDFHPQWLHFKLSDNEEYRMRFADRAVLYLSEGGLLDEEKTGERTAKRAAQIEEAIIAESARWGDQITGSPRNKYDDWLPEVNSLYSEYYPRRTNITINQLRDEDLYPDVLAPEVYRNDVLLTEQKYDINPGWIISLENPRSTGTLYYTFDGTDPRQIGGGLRESAREGGTQNVITLAGSTIITARVYSAGEWSGLRQLKFFAEEEDFSKLKVTEINYHPPYIMEGVDTVSGKNFEFIEFKNIGNQALNLSGVTIDSAIYYQFPPETILGPGQFYVVVSKTTRFYEKYALIGSGNFERNLSNSGERILVTDPSGDIIMDFSYSDQDSWPQLPDGDGPSLVAAEMNPTGDPGNPDYWRASFNNGGSPFEDDYLFDSIEEPIISDSESPEISLYPNPTRGEINIELSHWNPGEQVKISLYQLDGRFVAVESITENTKLMLGSMNVEAGVYILRLEGEGWSETRKLVSTR